MIYTACFFAPDDHVGGEGHIYSIANSQPHRNPLLPRLPLFRPGYLLDEYKSGEIDWTEYRHRYEQKKLYGQADEIRAWIFTLRWEGDVTLCCWERDPAQCHRKWAAEFLRELGQSVTIR